MFRFTNIITSLALTLVIISGFSLQQGYCQEQYYKILTGPKYLYYLDTNKIKVSISNNKTAIILNCWIKAQATKEGIKYRLEAKKKFGFQDKDFQKFDHLSLHMIISINLQSNDIHTQLLEITDYNKNDIILDYVVFPFQDGDTKIDILDINALLYGLALKYKTYVLNKGV
ncbi:MAG: hypothetical protein H6Q74_295 [Firmicutes bacterium]|nr:hypothetical protein [Bacillota bacterium]